MLNHSIPAESKLQEQLAEKELLFEVITEQLGAGFWDWHIADEYEYLSPRFKQMFGYKEHELSNSPGSWQKLIHPDDLEKVLQLFDAHVQSGGKIPYDSEVRYRHRNGSIIWVRCAGKVIKWAEDGSPLRMVGTHTDITESKQKEEAARKASNFMQELQKAANIGNWEVDLLNNKVYWSEETRHIHEVDNQYEPTVEKGIEFYADNDTEMVRAAVDEAVGQGSKFDLVARIITGKGNLRWVRTIGKVEQENGQNTRIWGVFQDITKDKVYEKLLLEQKEKAEEAARIKEEFLSTMSHEIRTPLNSVIGMAYMLLQGNPRPEQEERLRILKFSAENLLSLINDILDFNKIESGELALEEVPLDLRELAEGILQGQAYRAGEKRLRLKTMVDSSLPRQVKGDPTRLGQVLSNLVSNAIKFTSQGHVKVEVELEEQTDQEASIRFSVTDTGIGIPPEKQQLIFQRFTQAQDSTARFYGGTGLGLAITRRLVEMMGSEIKLKSTPDKGSVFSFLLRMKKVDDRPASTQAGPAYRRQTADEHYDLKGARILVVEDNPMNQIVAGEFLKKWKARVDYAHNGAIALEMLASKDYELVLMDIQMPEMDGLQACKQFRERFPERYARVNILALTATVGRRIKQTVQEAGMADYATKPFHPAEFYAKVARYLPKGFMQKHKNRQPDSLLIGGEELPVKDFVFHRLSAEKIQEIGNMGLDFVPRYLTLSFKMLQEFQRDFIRALEKGHIDQMKLAKYRVSGTMQQLGLVQLQQCACDCIAHAAGAQRHDRHFVADFTIKCAHTMQEVYSEINQLQQLIEEHLRQSSES